MFDASSFGQIHIDGKVINIDRLSIEELNNYLTQLESKNQELIEEQNKYIAAIINNVGK